MGVDADGDSDVGVAEEFLDDDEIDALLEEEGGGRVSEVVEADGPESCAVEEGAEAPHNHGRQRNAKPALISEEAGRAVLRSARTMCSPEPRRSLCTIRHRANRKR